MSAFERDVIIVGGSNIFPEDLESLCDAVPGVQPGRAVAFGVADERLGTYGGFSYLAPFYGVPSYTYYSDPDGFSRKHLTVAHEAFECCGAGARLEVEDASVQPSKWPPTGQR